VLNRILNLGKKQYGNKGIFKGWIDVYPEDMK